MSIQLMELVLGDLFILLESFELIVRLTSEISEGDFCRLGHFPDHLDQFLAPFFGQPGDSDADDLPVVPGVSPSSDLRMAFSISPMMLVSQG